MSGDTAWILKSDEARIHWREVLDHIQAGGTVTVVRYNTPIAHVVPVSTGEPSRGES